MRTILLLASFLILLSGEAYSQVFGIRRPNIWYLQATPGLAILLAHTGIDESGGTAVSDVFRWGASMNLDFGATARRFSVPNHLRLEYQESHSSGNLPVKGPSIFEFAARPTYDLKKDSTTSVGVAFQGGCYTALLPETQGDGVTTREFFNPASLYEGVFLSREDQIGRQNQLKISSQVGYSAQQLVYRRSPDLTSGGVAQTGETSSQNSGLTAFLAIEFVQQASPSSDQADGNKFFLNLSVKGFKKDSDFKAWKNSRVEGSMRVGLNFLKFLAFVSGAELVYDSDISPRRELRTSLFLSFRYNLDLSGQM